MSETDRQTDRCILMIEKAIAFKAMCFIERTFNSVFCETKKREGRYDVSFEPTLLSDQKMKVKPGLCNNS